MKHEKTLHAAADIVQKAAQDGRIALYIESKDDGDFRVVMADGNMSALAELVYAAADRIAEQSMNPRLPTIRMRD